ncbi:class I SAM-dependent methyltransferase [Pedobacter deserti]|uniref:class I SAM-dependent methyltransferase n=1 Tax=Pedobacter deserti TaxID=2817382 RepID=UPI00210E30BF|nr:class I SAM-dependent methyltransferase [Pedobacter sp. SYSU D00382]
MTNRNSEIFSEIYRRNLWGGNKGEFFSGPGSYGKNAYHYANVLADFIMKEDVVDIIEIGCGDFNVSRNVLNILRNEHYAYRYTGYDVVDELVTLNNDRHSTDNIRFICKDITQEDVLAGDLLLVRQVFQHLDNDNIIKIVRKFSNYKHVVVTEHQADRRYNFQPNLNKPTNADTRIGYRSSIYLELPPFNCKINSILLSAYEKAYGFDAYINTFYLSNHR